MDTHHVTHLIRDIFQPRLQGFNLGDHGSESYVERVSPFLTQS